MEKKVRNRILYAVVAGLWGIAIYRTIANHRAEEQMHAQDISTLPPVSPTRFNKDTFELELPSRDPFLAAAWTPVIKVPVPAGAPEKNDRANSEVTREVPALKETAWPKIEYFGFVKNHNQNSTLCLLKIDDHLIKLNKGEQYKGLLVQRTYKDSVQVMFKGEMQTVRK